MILPIVYRPAEGAGSVGAFGWAVNDALASFLTKKRCWELLKFCEFRTDQLGIETFDYLRAIP